MQNQFINSNSCQTTYQIQVCVSPNYQKPEIGIKKQQLLNFSKRCWDLYSPRLLNISLDIFELGKLEYENTNSKIIDTILELDSNPLKVSLSTTHDGSLHYTFRFKDGLTLFIETFLYLEEENHTYIELFRNDSLLYSDHQDIDTGLEIIKKRFPKNLSRNKDIFYLNYFNQDCD